MNLNANELRQIVLKMVFEKNSGHIGGRFSMAELIAYLYGNYNLCSNNIYDDKLILSKGHAVPIIYAALYKLGIISEDNLHTFREVNSQLQGHPDMNRFGMMHATTGSLGQGLSIAIGHAIAHQRHGAKSKIFCIIGDGEAQEGQIWESLMLAPKYELANLVAIFDLNGGQNDTSVEKTLSLGRMSDKIKSFDWNVIEIDGHNMLDLHKCFNNLDAKKPNCVLMHTIKGKGVKFMENPDWHSKVPTEDEYTAALKELKNA